MLKTRLPMKLSPEEELFLRQWIYDEAHYQDGQGPAKRLQLERRIPPADMALLIAAAIPDPAAQEAASLSPATPRHHAGHGRPMTFTNASPRRGPSWRVDRPERIAEILQEQDVSS